MDLIENYFVAYLDVLGSKKRILDAEVQSLNIIHELYSQILDKPLLYPHLGYNSLIINIFSDNIVVAEKYPTTDNSEDKINAFKKISAFIAEFQYLAFRDYLWVVRGALSVGPFYITKEDKEPKIIWGAALDETLQMENSQAIYPRVLISKKLRELFSNSDQEICDEYYIWRDSDGLYYNGYMDRHWVTLNSSTHMNEFKSRHLKLLTSPDNDDKMLQKHMWHAHSFNKECDQWKQPSNKIDFNKLSLNTEVYTPSHTKLELQVKSHLIAYLHLIDLNEQPKKDEERVNIIQSLYDETIQKLKTSLQKIYPHAIPSVKIFSDILVISEEVTDEVASFENGLLRLIYFVSYFQACALTKSRLLVRGAVTLGTLYIDDILVWGSGLLRAYTLEHELALYPRILFDRERILCSEHDHPLWIKSNGEYYSQDFDGLYYLNYEGHLNSKEGNLIDNCDEEIHKSLSAMLREYAKNELAIQQLSWSVHYHNYVCDKVSSKPHLRICPDVDFQAVET